MKTLEELKAFYHEVLMPDLQVLEAQRKKAAAGVIRNSCIVLGLMIAGAFLLGPLLSRNFNFLGFYIFAGIVGVALVYWLGTRKYTSEFKQKVIARLVEFIHPGLRYDHSGKIDRHLYQQSKLFHQQVDIYGGDDLVEGRAGATEIRFSELHTQYITHDSEGRTSHHTIFKGLFFVGDFNKHFHGRTVVLPDTAERILGGLGRFLQSKNFSRDDLIKMDDPEFEKEFVVYGTDQIEARYILTSSLMRRVLDFRRKNKKRIFLSFANSKVFAAIPYRKNLFEPRIFETLLNFRPIREYFNDLSVALGIVEDLNLNTRIWSKE